MIFELEIRGARGEQEKYSVREVCSYPTKDVWSSTRIRVARHLLQKIAREEGTLVSGNPVIDSWISVGRMGCEIYLFSFATARK